MGEWGKETYLNFDNGLNVWCGFRFVNDFWDGFTSKKCGMGDGVGTWYFILIGIMEQVNVHYRLILHGYILVRSKFLVSLRLLS